MSPEEGGGMSAAVTAGGGARGDHVRSGPGRAPFFSCESSSRNANVRLSVSQSVRDKTFFELINQPNKHQT